MSRRVFAPLLLPMFCACVGTAGPSAKPPGAGGAPPSGGPGPTPVAPNMPGADAAPPPTAPEVPLPPSHRAKLSFNVGWKFIRQDVPGAEAPAFDDVRWAPVST